MARHAALDCTTRRRCGLLTCDAMTVSLGPVTFSDREVPDVIPFGGKQAMAIHKNLGGRRTVDVMGPDPDPIQWRGLFFGKTASQRARLLDALRETGAELRLSWGSFNYRVVISHFRAVYKHEWEVQYEITVEVSTPAAITPFRVLEKIIKQDWGVAKSTPGLPLAIIELLIDAQSKVDSVALAQPNGLLENASLSALTPAIAAAESAYFAVDDLLKTTEVAIQGVSLDEPNGNSVVESFTAFQIEANNAAFGSNLRTARAYIGRIVGNLTTLGG